VVADLSVRTGQNWITGANRPGYHLRNANLPRDFEPGEWADLALIEAGDPCPHCGSPLSVIDAFRLAESWPPVPAVGEFLDEAGVPQPLRIAHWQLILGRLLPAIVERHHDEYGLIWPVACAPLGVHLVGLDLKQEAVAARAEALYARLKEEGLAVLYDDREASAGVKFADADLIGLPLRLTVGKRALVDGTIEAKWRGSPDRLKLDEAGLAAELVRLRVRPG
jgi:prolyl-tRNA synthetase